MPREIKSIEVPLWEQRTLSVAEAAKLTGLQRERLDEAIRAGVLKPMSVPGVTRLWREELERWMQAATCSTAT